MQNEISFAQGERTFRLVIDKCSANISRGAKHFRLFFVDRQICCRPCNTSTTRAEHHPQISFKKEKTEVHLSPYQLKKWTLCQKVIENTHSLRELFLFPLFHYMSFNKKLAWPDGLLSRPVVYRESKVVSHLQEMSFMLQQNLM